MVIYNDAPFLLSYMEEAFLTGRLESEYPTRLLTLGIHDEREGVDLEPVLDIWRDVASMATRSDTDIVIDESGYLSIKNADIVYEAFDKGIADEIEFYFDNYDD